MGKIILYHGSNVVVSEPRILINGHYKDLDTDFIVPILKSRQNVGHSQEKANPLLVSMNI